MFYFTGTVVRLLVFNVRGLQERVGVSGGVDHVSVQR